MAISNSYLNPRRNAKVMKFSKFKSLDMDWKDSTIRAWSASWKDQEEIREERGLVG